LSVRLLRLPKHETISPTMTRARGLLGCLPWKRLAIRASDHDGCGTSSLWAGTRRL